VNVLGGAPVNSFCPACVNGGEADCERFLIERGLLPGGTRTLEAVPDALRFVAPFGVQVIVIQPGIVATILGSAGER